MRLSDIAFALWLQCWKWAGRYLDVDTCMLFPPVYYPRYRFGEATRGEPRICDFTSDARLFVGRHVSFAQRVVIMLGGNHRLDVMDYSSWNAAHKGKPEDWMEPAGDVYIGDYAWIGYGALILGCRGLRIGHHAVVGAGAVVTRDVPDYAVVAGNPARIVNTRKV